MIINYKLPSEDCNCRYCSNYGKFGKMASRATDLEHFKDIAKRGFLALPPGER